MDRISPFVRDIVMRCQLCNCTAFYAHLTGLHYFKIMFRRRRSSMYKGQRQPVQHTPSIQRLPLNSLDACLTQPGTTAMPLTSGSASMDSAEQGRQMPIGTGTRWTSGADSSPRTTKAFCNYYPGPTTSTPIRTELPLAFSCADKSASIEALKSLTWRTHAAGRFSR